MADLITEPTPPLRRAVIIRAIEDYAARYAWPHHPIVNDPARYIAEGHVPGGATGAEWEWIAEYIQQHPEMIAAPPLTEQQLHERNREREARAAELGEQAHAKFNARDYTAAYRLVDQAELIDPSPAKWVRIRGLIDQYANNPAGNEPA